MSTAVPEGAHARGDLPGAGGRLLRAVAAALAVVGQLVVGYFVLAAIGLLGMPAWAALLLAVAWFAGAVVIVRLVRSHALYAPAVPVVCAFLLWGLVAVGGAWLGWRA